MCLDRLATKYEEEYFQRLIKRGCGWKCYDREEDGTLSSDLRGNFKTQPINRWLKEKDYRNARDKTSKTLPLFVENRRYPIGFHVCLTREGARDWGYPVRKVKFKDVRAMGWQDEFPCIVAGQTLITKDKG